MSSKNHYILGYPVYPVVNPSTLGYHLVRTVQKNKWTLQKQEEEENVPFKIFIYEFIYIFPREYVHLIQGFLMYLPFSKPSILGSSSISHLNSDSLIRLKLGFLFISSQEWRMYKSCRKFISFSGLCILYSLEILNLSQQNFNSLLHPHIEREISSVLSQGGGELSNFNIRFLAKLLVRICDLVINSMKFSFHTQN